MNRTKKNLKKQRRVAFGYAALSLLFIGTAFADGGGTLGSMASNITTTFDNIGKLITAASYVAGLGFAVGAIMKFKQHKDNPTQVQIGQPIGLLIIAMSLLFMPTLLKVGGATMFGSATTAGAHGTSIGGTQ